MIMFRHSGNAIWNRAWNKSPKNLSSAFALRQQGSPMAQSCLQPGQFPMTKTSG
jgi:hypothetical protein